MKRLLIALAAYSSMTLSGFAVLAYLQIQDLRLQIIAGLILLATAICIFMGTKQKNKETEQGFGISICLVATASLSSIAMYQTNTESWLIEAMLMLVFTSFIQIVVALPGQQRPRQNNYALLLISFQKLLALIIIMLATQELLTGMHVHFSSGVHLP
jgi:small neutral amino acid transporter SnatA (MarC family)